MSNIFKYLKEARVRSAVELRQKYKKYDTIVKKHEPEILQHATKAIDSHTQGFKVDAMKHLTKAENLNKRIRHAEKARKIIKGMLGPKIVK